MEKGQKTNEEGPLLKNVVFLCACVVCVWQCPCSNFLPHSLFSHYSILSVAMLTDKSFRRTVHCSKYSQLIKEKDQAPLITPFKIQTIDGECDATEQ